jgi:hypothetical protein
LRQSLLVEVCSATACMPLLQQVTSAVLEYASNSIIFIFVRSRVEYLYGYFRNKNAFVANLQQLIFWFYKRKVKRKENRYI